MDINSKVLGQGGQALIEYVFVFVFILFIAGQFLGGFTDFFSETMGNVAHHLSVNLHIGLCENDCFYSSYQNGYQGQ